MYGRANGRHVATVVEAALPEEAVDGAGARSVLQRSAREQSSRVRVLRCSPRGWRPARAAFISWSCFCRIAVGEVRPMERFQSD